MRKRITLLFAALLMLLAAQGQDEKRVLFIGNSYTSVNDLPRMVSDVANSCGDRIVYESNIPGGCTFSQHCTNQSMELINQGGWDIVVLQEQSQYPAFPPAQVEAEVFPYARQLVSSIYAASPCAEPMFYMTWGRKNGDRFNGDIYPPIGTYEGMDSLLALRYGMMAEENDAALCPVGRVWHWLRHNHPAIELYQDDESHPSVAGSYAAACAFYTMFFHRDPSGITFNASLDDDVAATIRSAVRTVVFDSLDRWQRPVPGADVDIVESSDLMVHTIVLSDDNADTLSIDWGDGSDTLFVASGTHNVEHRYAAEGDYTVSLHASRHCMAADQSWSFSARQGTVDPAGIGSAPDIAVTVTPNPASRQVRVLSSQAMRAVELRDLKGNLVDCRRLNGETATLTVSHLPSGIYLLKVTAANNVQTTRTLVVR